MKRVQHIDREKYPEQAQIKPGDRVMIRSVWDEWLEATAVSELEGTHETVYDGTRAHRRKIHDFPVVWITRTSERRIPWPAEDVKRIEHG